MFLDFCASLSLGDDLFPPTPKLHLLTLQAGITGYEAKVGLRRRSYISLLSGSIVINLYYRPVNYEIRTMKLCSYTLFYYDAYQQWDLSVPRHYPQVDTGQLEDSVTRFQKLIKEADLLINRLANSREFSTQLISEFRNLTKIKSSH